MVLNIYFQIAGLIIAVICAYFCFAQKRLNFSAERQFLRLVAGVILSIFLDIMSVVAITDRTSVGDFWTEIICRVYLISIVFAVYAAFGFSTVDIVIERRKLKEILMILPLLFEVVFAFVFPIEIHDESGIYTAGVPVLMTYIFAVFYMICSVSMIFAFKNQIARRKRMALYGWYVAWITAGLIQFFNNEILIASFTMAMGCMYMYVKLQNPEYHLDLTFNIFNRRAFLAALEEGKRFNKHRAVVAFQIFNMNSVNEIFGNRTLRALMSEICDYAKEIPQSTEFKIDDNMFALIVSDRERVEAIAEQLEKRFTTPWEVNGIPINVKAGVVYLLDVQNTDNNEVEEIFHFFLEKLKRSNRVYMEINEEALALRRRNFEIQHALDWALSNDGVEVFYQPIYGIREGRFVALEALVRIKDENGNLIMPGEFIEFAEKNGMILKLGEEIFRKVCIFIKLNKIGDYGLEYIEVNLSVVQCMQEDLAKTFTNMMGEYQIPPHQINFEITETAAINTRESLENNMSAFLKYGNTFSLDDYGSGYSNLTYIVEMPLKIIKIDRSLTIAYDTSQKAKVATEYTVEMVHKLGMEIVVEGIETEEQYMNFKKLGVEFIQGYYFSKPLPSDRVLSYVREWL